MTESTHPAASDHLPSFITAPGETDVLMVVMAIILLLFVLMVGVLYFRLHALPERFAHKKVQFEIVCVLALLAMFTHTHIFWIAGLLLALIDFPAVYSDGSRDQLRKSLPKTREKARIKVQTDCRKISDRLSFSSHLTIILPCIPA